MFKRQHIAPTRCILASLDPETTRTLALLHKTTRGVAELTIASLDPGTRSLLMHYGFIADVPRPHHPQRLTPLGREVIKLCALHITAPTGHDLDAAIHQASSLLSLAPTAKVRAVPA